MRGGGGEGGVASLASREGAECPPLSQGEKEKETEREGDELASAQARRPSRLRLVAVLKKASFESNGVQASMSFVRFASGGEGERE